MLEIMEFLLRATGIVAWFTADRVIGVVGLILAFVAIGLAYYHVRKLRKVLKKVSAVLEQAELQQQQAELQQKAILEQAEFQRQQATSHANRLDAIKESLSTRYLGEFPRYFDKIVEVISKAEKRIIILCDYPGYGSFSDRKNWLRYKHTIEQKLQDGVKIELTCFNETLRRTSLDEQFFDSNEWDNWKLVPDNVKLLEELLKWHKGSPPVSDLLWEQCSDLLAREEQDALTQTFQTAEIKQIDTYAPLYFWIADEKRAVFAIASVSNKEYGFFTIDRQIISALIEMRNRYHRTTAIHQAP